MCMCMLNWCNRASFLLFVDETVPRASTEGHILPPIFHHSQKFGMVQPHSQSGKARGPISNPWKVEWDNDHVDLFRLCTQMLLNFPSRLSVARNLSMSVRWVEIYCLTKYRDHYRGEGQ